jgi:16S rRNA (guanine966-N2)-methyltransferase
VRVIAGLFGGLRLVAPRGLATRPTSDRVREALFSILGDVSSAVALDLYAGTGALGIEALSRGAARAVFVENARPALAALRENIDALKLQDRAKILARSVERAARELSREGPFDLIFLDPPYAKLPEIPGVIAELEANRAIAALGRLVVEHASKDPAPLLPGFSPEPSRAYGDTSVTIYRREGA